MGHIKSFSFFFYFMEGRIKESRGLQLVPGPYSLTTLAVVHQCLSCEIKFVGHIHILTHEGEHEGKSCACVRTTYLSQPTSQTGF